MPSALHEIIVELFHSRPELAPELLRDSLGIDVPVHTRSRVEKASFADLRPAELRADLVLLLENEEPVMGIVVEAQLAADENKRFAWPAYAVPLRARFRCPTVVLVVAPIASVANWAAAPIELGGSSMFAPVVLGQTGVPVVTAVEDAVRRPQLAVLSAIAHGEGARGLEVARSALQAVANLPNNQQQLYSDLIVNALNQAARDTLEQEMDLRSYEFKTDFFQRHRQGGAADLLLRQLIKRFGPLDAGVEERLDAATMAELQLWGERLLDADTLDAVFDQADG